MCYTLQEHRISKGIVRIDIGIYIGISRLFYYMLMLSKYIGIGLGCVVNGFSVVSVFRGATSIHTLHLFIRLAFAIFCRARCVCAEILGPGRGAGIIYI